MTIYSVTECAKSWCILVCWFH